MARIAANWMTISKISPFSSFQLRRLPTTIKCPVLETGKNSVSPSTTPSIKALIATMRPMSPPYFAQKKRPGRREAVGALYQLYYLVAEELVVVDFLCFLLLALWVLALGAGVVLSAAAGVPALGASAASEAAAKPKVNKAVVIRVADFFMRSPNVVWAKALREYDGIRHLSRDEDHFTMATSRDACVLRACHARQPNTATFASRIREAVLRVVSHSAQRFSIHKPMPATAKTAA